MHIEGEIDAPRLQHHAAAAPRSTVWSKRSPPYSPPPIATVIFAVEFTDVPASAG
jgi:hypothetical protein